ncbi:zinc finger MYND domain-containing protein 10 isoform X1 [Amia ocellicauda]|uniref:zinc finger MYND domain-containing protein 10 isoform X1 n=1 Tax=Amia ocellicauda TaxID=2972642 RepID=UPI003464BED5
MESAAAVLLPGEVEGFVRGLERFPLRDIGSPRWFRQHEYVQKLNMQAILSASCGQEELVKEQLVSVGKIPTLVHEMISVEIWKQKVLPVLSRLRDFNPKSTFPLYMVIHHEATIINLLETILFHQDSCESAEPAVLDLIDYCHRKLTLLAARNTAGDAAAEDGLPLGLGAQTDSTLQELLRLSSALEFDIALKALSVLRYVSDHIDSFSLSALTRLLSTHNLPCVLVHLVETCPWSRRSKGQLEKYVDGKWLQIPREDQLKMTKLDGQVWIALLNLLLRPDCQKKYDFNSFNKSQLLKLRGFLTEVLIDQLPNLSELQVFLSHLSITDSAPPKQGLVLEQIPEMWNDIMKENSGKWKAIAKYQVKEAFNPSDEDLRQQAHRLAQTYSLDVMESLVPDKPRCGFCGSEASKRCSRCQGEWYCHRQCQVKHWPKHKRACELMAEAVHQTQEDRKSAN